MGYFDGSVIWNFANDQLVIKPEAQVLIQTDASNKGCGAVCWGIRTGSQWSKKEQDLHINQLQLLVINFSILNFAKMWKISAIHIQVDNMTALSYLLKMGGTRYPELMQISKKIWEFLLGQGVAITAEKNIREILGKKPEIDLFPSRLSNQLPSY